MDKLELGDRKCQMEKLKSQIGYGKEKYHFKSLRDWRTRAKNELAAQVSVSLSA